MDSLNELKEFWISAEDDWAEDKIAEDSEAEAEVSDRRELSSETREERLFSE